MLLLLFSVVANEHLAIEITSKVAHRRIILIVFFPDKKKCEKGKLVESQQIMNTVFDYVNTKLSLNLLFAVADQESVVNKSEI